MLIGIFDNVKDVFKRMWVIVGCIPSNTSTYVASVPTTIPGWYIIYCLGQ
jgi:hypothetical protein